MKKIKGIPTRTLAMAITLTMAGLGGLAIGLLIPLAGWTITLLFCLGWGIFTGSMTRRVENAIIRRFRGE